VFLSTQEYRLPGAEMSQHWRLTHRGILRGVVTQRRDLIFVYIGDSCWHRYVLEALEAAALELAARDESALAQGQEVESEDKTRRDRD
jgi:hypothetical protein